MSNEPRRNVYVGHRYVPKIMGEWDNTNSYEGLSIVTYQGASYTSKKHVPIGIDILNEEFWVNTGNYNAQVEQYRIEVRNLQQQVDDGFLSVDQKIAQEVDLLKEYTDDTVNTNFQLLKDDLDNLELLTNQEIEDLKAKDQEIVDDIESLNSLVDVIDKDRKVVLLDIEAFGTDGTGLVNDTVAIQNAIDEASKTGAILKARKGKKYLVDNIEFKDGVFLLNGAEFIASGTNSDNEYAINVSDGALIDELKVVLKPSTTADRTVKIGSNSKVGRIHLTAEQQHNVFNDNIDAGLVITGDNIEIDTIRVDKFDDAVTMFNVTNSTINNVYVTNYKRGVYLRKTKHLNIDKIVTYGKSVNAGWTPGHNGLLIEETEDTHIDYVSIADTGEHGIRLGGLRDGQYRQKGFHFGKVVTKNTGGCGFKVFSGQLVDEAVTIKGIHIDSLTVINAGFKLPSLRNRDGLYLNTASDIHIGEYRCYTDGEPFSSTSGIYATMVDRCYINSVDIKNTSNTGITLDIENGRVNDFYVDSANIRGTGNEAILIDHSGEVIRDIIFKNLYIREFGQAYHGVKVVASLVYQPLIVEGIIKVGGSAGAFTRNITNDNIINKLEEI